MSQFCSNHDKCCRCFAAVAWAHRVTKGSGRFVYFHIHSFLAYSLLHLQSSGSFGYAAVIVMSFMWMFCMELQLSRVTSLLHRSVQDTAVWSPWNREVMLKKRAAAPGLSTHRSGVDILLKTVSAHQPGLYKQPWNTHRQTGRKVHEVSGIAHVQWNSKLNYWGGGRESADPILPSTR